MPADNDLDPVDRWLDQQVWPMSPPDGAFEQISKRARRRRVRKAVVSVGSAAAVIAAIAVAVPLGLSANLGSSKTPSIVAAGSTPVPHKTQSTLGRGTMATTPAPSATQGPPSPTATPDINTPGFVPANFEPFSVTWTSQSTGWVIGPAGTPGHCGAQEDSDICTSIARTDDGGATWVGVRAPVAEGPYEASGVSSLRFLDPTYGWAFGPDLWATTDGGADWHQVSTGGESVTDLEATNSHAYALFGTCSPPAGTTGDTIANCTSYTLETSPAGQDNWTPVSGVPQNMTEEGPSKYGSAVIEVGGSTVYLAAPDGELFAGTGTDWHEVGILPCGTGPADNDGLPQDLMLAAAGTTSSGATRLVAVCNYANSNQTIAFTSVNGGASWAQEDQVGSGGLSHIGTPQSLTALSDGTLILATGPSTNSSGGIYLLAPGATAWQAATLTDSSGASYGFTYVGMTTPTQGVAIGGNPKLDGIWMTTNGGKTWEPRPITSG